MEIWTDILTDAGKNIIPCQKGGQYICPPDILVTKGQTVRQTDRQTDIRQTNNHTQQNYLDFFLICPIY